MSHAVVLVVTEEEPTEDLLNPILEPWYEVWDKIDPKYTAWEDHTAECRKEWEEEGTTKYKSPDGTLRHRFDDFYKKPGTFGSGSGTSTHYDPVEKFDHEKVFIPYKEEYPDFFVFATEYHGYEITPDGEPGKVGWYHNPNAKWDWWAIGGRWKDRIVLTPDQRPSFQNLGDFIQKKSLHLDVQRRARAALKKKWIDESLQGLKEKKGMDKEEALQIWVKICAQKTFLRESYELNKNEDKLHFRRWVDAAVAEETAGDYDADLQDAAAFIRSEKGRAVSQAIGGIFGDLVPIHYKDPYDWAADATAFDWVQAIVVDGEWHEQGEMGWFGYSNQDMTDGEWTKKLMGLIENVPDDHYICVVDYHI